MPSYVRGSDNFDSGQVVGQNQTWQDVTESRAAGTTYTNNTGKPIMVAICTSGSGTAQDNTISINGVIVARAFQSSSSVSTMSVIVPSGATYLLTTSHAPSKWSELR